MGAQAIRNGLEPVTSCTQNERGFGHEEPDDGMRDVVHEEIGIY